MARNVGSRVFHGFMVVPCAFICLMAVISFGSFANIHDQIRNGEKDEHGESDDTYCILFTNSRGKRSGHVRLGKDGPCVFSIWGEVGVCLVSIVIGVVFVLKAVIGVPALSFFLLAELVTVILTGMLDFAVAIVISAGLDHTCDAFNDSHKNGEKLKCSLYGYKVTDESDDTFRFYHYINTAKATAWIGTCILAIMAGILFVMLFAYFYRRSHQPPRGVPYGHMEQDKEDIEHERNEKDELPAAV